MNNFLRCYLLSPDITHTGAYRLLSRVAKVGSSLSPDKTSNMKRLLPLTLLLAINNANSASDGNAFYELCTTKEGYCTAFLAGYVHGARIHGGRFCIPEKVNSGQVLDVVIQYLQQNPAYRYKEVYALINTAIHEAWPCE